MSFRRGQKYLIVVVDHDSGRLVWAAEGRGAEALDRFFFELGSQRAKLITHVSADAGSWIANVVSARCPNATRCMDPFHFVQWATDALDQIRREVWNAVRRGRHQQHARDLKGARWALWKGGERLTERQRAKQVTRPSGARSPRRGRDPHLNGRETRRAPHGARPAGRQ